MRRQWPATIRNRIPPLLPLVVLALLAVAISLAMSRHLGDTVMAGGKDAKFGPSEFAPGEELTANGQSVVKDGIFAVARVTKGIAEGSVYMERFWNPEFLEDGSDGRKSWTTENMNVLTKNTGYFNPEFGTYTLRGIHVNLQRDDDGLLTFKLTQTPAVER